MSGVNLPSFLHCLLHSLLQDNLVDALHTLPDLGLKLSKTQSFLDKLDQIVQEQNSNAGEYAYSNSVTKSKDILQQANKMKAENFPISLLSIGSWQVKPIISLLCN